MPDSRLATGDSRLALGCMTGTSLDGLDASLVEITGVGLSMRARLIAHSHAPFGELSTKLRALAAQCPFPPGEIASLAHQLALFHVERLARLAADRPIDLIALHGQTIHHAPPVSWQLVNPWPVVERFRVPVVFDLRGADLASGGQGAPITPIADWVLFRAAQPRAIVNLGGFCNITLLPGSGEPDASNIRAMDVCACNHVLDAAARVALGAPYDKDGAAAGAGRIHDAARDELAAILSAQSASRRSLGTGDEAAAWVGAWAARLTGPDLCASAVDAVARTVADAVGGGGDVFLAGGGARNRALATAIAHHLRREARTTADLGVPVEARESACMAAIGMLCRDRVPITLPQVTGRRDPAPLAGAWALP